MAVRGEKSQLKRDRASAGEGDQEAKKPRRSERISSQAHTGTPLNPNAQLPSPLTHAESTTTDDFRAGTVTPPEGRPSQIQHRSPVSSPPRLSSPPSETQPFSQFILPSQSARDVYDEKEEGVWGYLIPLDTKFGGNLVLRRRTACPAPCPNTGLGDAGTRGGRAPCADHYIEEENEYEKVKARKGFSAGGYLIGRHPECDRVVHLPTISNRHCLIFSENRDGESVAVLEDLSSNGTFVNEALVGRNKRRELQENDEITILDQARFIFRYPRHQESSEFRQRYRILQKLGKGHFASVYLCVEKTTGERFAVKRFEKRPGERFKTDGLEQEIAVLMGISHPNLLCLKETYNEDDGVYLVLELAAEGELFNWIVMKRKLSEEESRRVFIQLFQGMKYLHERGVVHRDIKPENILLCDKELKLKIADFGLAKIIGEESFTTTLCGTPSYVAPEILKNSKHRRYTRAVDVWSLGVVLYICLCGFPPFSDELNTPDNPYPLSQQIKLGRFDYPSPYWDSVGDPALDLIDRMLTVDPDKRATIDECLSHPWITQRVPNPADSTDGLTGAMGSLDFAKRKMARERTLISSINDIQVEQVVNNNGGGAPIKIWAKNEEEGRKVNAPAWDGTADPVTETVDGVGNGDVTPDAKGKNKAATTKKNGVEKKEQTPAELRDPAEFMQMGGKGDLELFPDEEGSNYPGRGRKK